MLTKFVLTLYMFGHFVGFALKGLMLVKLTLLFKSITKQIDSGLHLNPLMHKAQNGQTHVKNFAANAARFLKCV